MPEVFYIVGVDGSGDFGVDSATLSSYVKSSCAVVGSDRQIDILRGRGHRDLPPVYGWNKGSSELIARLSETHGPVLVLASGDPGFFGVVRLLEQHFPPTERIIHPCISSVALAFARIGTSWEDALVVSTLGRPYRDFLRDLMNASSPRSETTKIAVLCSPETRPESVAQIFLDLKARFTRYFVCSKIGTEQESIVEADLSSLARGKFDALSIFAATTPGRSTRAVSATPGGAFPQTEYLHRDQMITKPASRELVLAKVLPYLTGPSKCLWDLGAGSGSVGISIAKQLPGLQVVLVDKDPLQVRLIELNSAGLPDILVKLGTSQELLDELPEPDAVFVGGGGLEVLRSVARQVRRPTFVAATHASIARAAEAADLLGNLMQVNLPIGKRLGDGSWHLEGENPVFLTWGMVP